MDLGQYVLRFLVFGTGLNVQIIRNTNIMATSQKSLKIDTSRFRTESNAWNGNLILWGLKQKQVELKSLVLQRLAKYKQYKNLWRHGDSETRTDSSGGFPCDKPAGHCRYAVRSACLRPPRGARNWHTPCERPAAGSPLALLAGVGDYTCFFQFVKNWFRCFRSNVFR